MSRIPLISGILVGTSEARARLEAERKRRHALHRRRVRAWRASGVGRGGWRTCSRCLPRFYERSPKGSIPDVVYMGIAHRGGTLREINSRFARTDRAEIYAKPGDPSCLVLRLGLFPHRSPLYPLPLPPFLLSIRVSSRRTDRLFTMLSLSLVSSPIGL